MDDVAEKSKSPAKRLLRALFKIAGPAQVGLPPYASEEERARFLADRAKAAEPRRPASTEQVPPGYHLETYVDESGVTRRVARPDT